MLDVSKDIHSLTEFKSKTARFVARLKKSEGALLLTVNGKAELAVMSAATFQHLLDELDQLETLRGIKQGLADVEAGRTRPLEEFVAEFRKKRGLPEPER
ncbi:MAG: type II toxin-antitoxin system Phd/YefM family antitoxin [Planctomycetota bacterium]